MKVNVAFVFENDTVVNIYSWEFVDRRFRVYRNWFGLLLEVDREELLYWPGLIGKPGLSSTLTITPTYGINLE